MDYNLYFEMYPTDPYYKLRRTPIPIKQLGIPQFVYVNTRKEQ